MVFNKVIMSTDIAFKKHLLPVRAAQTGELQLQRARERREEELLRKGGGGDDDDEEQGEEEGSQPPQGLSNLSNRPQIILREADRSVEQLGFCGFCFEMMFPSQGEKKRGRNDAVKLFNIKLNLRLKIYKNTSNLNTNFDCFATYVKKQGEKKNYPKYCFLNSHDKNLKINPEL